MSASNKRIAELLERWLASLELHSKYLDLSNEDYARAQAWPPHQRPTRWIIDLAKSRTVDLKRVFDQRQDEPEFADALELMSFLTTLLGAEHVERFIPQAVAPKHGQDLHKASASAQKPAPIPPESGPAKAAASPSGAPTKAPTAKTSDQAVPVIAPLTAPIEHAAPPAKPTSERLVPAARSSTAARVIPAANRNRNDSTIIRGPAAKSSGAGSRPRVTPAARTQSGSQRATKHNGAKNSATGSRVNEKLVNQVVADAVRMLEWGREWPQLAGLIARLADRPPEKDVWRILREHKTTIEARAKPPAD